MEIDFDFQGQPQVETIASVGSSHREAQYPITLGIEGVLSRHFPNDPWAGGY